MYNRIIFWRAAGCFNSALAILEELEGKVGHRKMFIRKLENSTVIPHTNDLIINWGNGGYNSWKELVESDVRVLNLPENVKTATNKIKTFEALDKKKVSTLKWTTSKRQANSWLDMGHDVVGRKTVSGCCGEGIEIYNKDTNNEVEVCPLYTLYQKKRHEYRVHVFNGKVIDIVQKKKKKGAASPTLNKIRNVDDGWAFCHNNLEIKDINRLNRIGIDAVKACNLTFGAVDIIWNEKQDTYYVVEVNTAPGLESSTIKCYANAILEEINNG